MMEEKHKYFFFFFQAEDGIRDLYVTGVQTCALPIWVRGQEHDSDHDVMTSAMIRQLPKARTLIIRGGLSPVISKLPPVWRERAYRKARRRNEAVAVLMPASVAAFALGEPERQQFAPEPVVRLRPAGSLPGDITPAGWDGEPAEDGAELAEVLPFHGAADDAAPRPWRSS